MSLRTGLALSRLELHQWWLRHLGLGGWLSPQTLGAALAGELEEQGVMFAAGPVSVADGSAWKGEGVFVYRAASLEDAIRIAEQDPMHTSGARRFEVRAWCLNEGTSTRSAGPEPEM